MLFNEDVYRFMYAALIEAQVAFEENEIPVGALIVKDGKIIAKGHNQTQCLKDATAHAEMIAITSASNYLQSWRLDKCDLYVTAEPCVMCTGAIIASRIKNVYFGTFEPKFGACGSLYNIAGEGKCNHKVNVFSGILAEESRRLMEDFCKRNLREK